jgi:hypothetical protein
MVFELCFYKEMKLPKMVFDSCRLNDLVKIVSTPPENARLQVHRALLRGTISEMKEAIQGCAGYLVFNVDDG